MKTSSKTLVFLLVAALLTALVTTLAFWAFRQAEATSQAQTHTLIVIQNAEDLMSELKDAETGQRGYVLTGDETFLQPYLAVRGLVNKHMQELRQLNLIPTGQQHLDTMAPLIAAKIADLATVIDLRQQHDMAGAVALISKGEGKRQMDAIRLEMRAFIKIKENALLQQQAEFQANMRLLFAVILLSCLLTMLFAVAFAYLIYRQTEQRLKQVTDLQTQHLLKVQQDANKA